jgi:nucleotide-binding universal stress UspA family protein
MLITATFFPKVAKWIVRKEAAMKVLLAVDGSPCSESAVEALIHQYKPADTEVLVLHAVECFRLTSIPYNYGMGPVFHEDYAEITKQWRREAEQLVARLSKRLETAGFKTSSKVEEGDARELILEYAGKWRPDLILMGSHGKRGLDRFLLGSVSEAVARHARCSVEIVRGQVAAA